MHCSSPTAEQRLPFDASRPVPPSTARHARRPSATSWPSWPGPPRQLPSVARRTATAARGHAGTAVWWCVVIFLKIMFDPWIVVNRAADYVGFCCVYRSRRTATPSWFRAHGWHAPSSRLTTERPSWRALPSSRAPHAAAGHEAEASATPGTWAGA